MINKKLNIIINSNNININNSNINNSKIYMASNIDNTTYWRLMRIMERILVHCNIHNIIIFPEFGTIIGMKRHSNIIPWDYDGDFGVMMIDKDRLVTSYQNEWDDDIIIDNNYYKDDGCCVFRFKDNINDIVDIVFYKTDDNKIVSCMSKEVIDEYPSKTNYSYDISDFYPLKEELFLGYRVHVPMKYEKYLVTEYGDWTQYPEEWKHMYNTKETSSPFIFIDELNINEFDEFKILTQTKNVPFILKNTNLLQCNRSKFDEIIGKQHTKVMGYENSITWTESSDTIENIYKKYIDKKLKINILESSVDDKSILSFEWSSYAKQILGDNYDLSLCWIFTNAPKVTYFHIDPSYAGGHMKLLCGKKIWWCILDNDIKYLSSKGYTIDYISKMNITDLLQLDDCYLWGKIYIGMISTNDLLWFPINCAHRVVTLESSYGFGGYL